MAYADPSGAATIVNAYDEYGRPGASNAEFLQYAGQLAVTSAPGLYNNRNRFYQADIGRFMQTDPILYYAGLNLYAYVGNDPMNWIDPWGLEPTPPRPQCPPPSEGECTTVIAEPRPRLPRARPHPINIAGEAGRPLPDDPDDIVVIGIRQAPQHNVVWPEIPFFCPVAELELSLGFQAAINIGIRGVLGAGAQVDLISVRSTVDLMALAEGRLSSAVSSDYTLGVGWTGSIGVPGTDIGITHTESTGIAANVATPTEWVDTSQRGDDGFIGLDIGAAAGLGGNLRLGYQSTENLSC